MKAYFDIIEGIGYKASREQPKKLFHRYYFVAQFCVHKNVLEIGCGSGSDWDTWQKKQKDSLASLLIKII